jgi:hypothetical protein
MGTDSILIALEKEIEQLENILRNKKKKYDEIKNTDTHFYSYLRDWMQEQKEYSTK